LKEEIKNIVSELRRITLIERQLEELLKVREVYQSEKITLDQELNKIGNRSESLQSVSLTMLYSKLLRRKKKEINTLNNQYLKLSIQRNDCIQLIADLDWEVELLSRLIAKQQALKVSLQSEVRRYKGQFVDQSLHSLKLVINAIQQKVSFSREIEEAIDQGVITNKKLNKILKLLKQTAVEIYDTTKDSKVLLQKPVSDLERYQKQVVSVRHSLMKFELELADLQDQNYEEKIYWTTTTVAFIQQYRENLEIDLTVDRSMNYSYSFLKGLKKSVMSTTRTLRREQRKIQKQIARLEKQESKLLYDIKYN